MLSYLSGGEQDLLTRLLWVARDGTTTRVEGTPAGGIAPRLSPDGRWVSLVVAFRVLYDSRPPDGTEKVDTKLESGVEVAF